MSHLNYFTRYLVKSRHFTALVLSVTIVFSLARNAEAQNGSSEDNKDCGCVKLVGEMEKMSLSKGDSTRILVQYKNNSDRNVEILSDPLFNFRRVGVNKRDYIYGDSYSGRIATNSGNEKAGSESITLNYITVKAKTSYEFAIDLSKLELHTSMDSFNVWPNIFDELRNGDYWVSVIIFLKSVKRSVKDDVECQSNTLVISYVREKNGV